MKNERPDGWVEPVHEALMRPASFYGAAPRNAVIGFHVLAALVLTVAALAKSWILMLAALGALSFVQMGTAALSYIEPHWFELVVEWLRSPQSRVEP